MGFQVAIQEVEPSKEATHHHQTLADQCEQITEDEEAENSTEGESSPPTNTQCISRS